MKEIIWIVIHVPFNILILRCKIYNQYVSLMLVIMHIDTDIQVIHDKAKSPGFWQLDRILQQTTK